MNSRQYVDVANTKPEQRPWRRTAVPIALAPLMAFLGLQSFISVTSNPRFESIHTLDVIRLMTAGAAFAIMFALLIMFFKFRALDRIPDNHP